MRLLLCVLGLLLIMEGLPYFAFPDHMKKWMSLVMETPDNQLRLIGFFAMGLGLFLAHLSRFL